MIAATGMTFFSLAAVFTATFAWFALNTKVGGDGMSVQVKEEGKAYKTGLTIHRCLTNESTAHNLSFNHSPASTSQYKIDDYTQLNTTQPVLLLFPMGEFDTTTGEYSGALASQIKIEAVSPTNVAYSDVEVNDSSAPNYYKKFPFSSACSFRAVAWTEEVPTNDTPTTDPTRYYVKLSELEENDPRCFISSPQTFVTPTSMSSVAWNGSSLTLFDGSTLTNASDITIKYVGVIIDYYEPALSLIFRAGGYSGDEPLIFYMDFTLVIS